MKPNAIIKTSGVELSVESSVKRNTSAIKNILIGALIIILPIVVGASFNVLQSGAFQFIFYAAIILGCIKIFGGIISMMKNMKPVKITEPPATMKFYDKSVTIETSNFGNEKFKRVYVISYNDLNVEFVKAKTHTRVVFSGVMYEKIYEKHNGEYIETNKTSLNQNRISFKISKAETDTVLNRMRNETPINNIYITE